MALPDGWHLRRIHEIAEVVGGATPTRSEPAYFGGSIPWVTPTDVTGSGGRYLVATKECVNEAGVRAAGLRLLPPGTILLTSRASIGHVTITCQTVTTNQGFQSVVPSDGVDSHWLYYAISAKRPELERMAAGSTFREVSQKSVRNVSIAVPPYLEQVRIAEVLTAIDDAIEKTEAVIAATDQFRRALLHDLLTRGLPGRHTAWKQVPGIGMMPICWDVVSIGSILVDIQAGTSPVCLPRAATADEWGILKLSSISWDVFRPEENKALVPGTVPDRNAEIRSGDVLMSHANVPDLVGKTVYVEYTPRNLLLSDITLRLVPDTSQINRRFLDLVLHHAPVRRYIQDRAHGSSMSMVKVSRNIIRNISIPLPTMREQDAICKAASCISQSARVQAGVLASYRTLKGHLAEALLSGRVLVPMTGEPDPKALAAAVAAG